MPRFWYIFTGPQNASGYSTLGNYLYYGFPGNPPCTDGFNICAIYALGDPFLIHLTATNPINISPANSRIPAAKSNGADQFIGTRLYVKVRFEA